MALLDFFLETLVVPFDGEETGSETVECEAEARIPLKLLLLEQ